MDNSGFGSGYDVSMGYMANGKFAPTAEGLFLAKKFLALLRAEYPGERIWVDGDGVTDGVEELKNLAASA